MDEIITGDCLSELQDLEPESAHAIVTDPPYGLNFMADVTDGWDDFEPKEYQGFCENWARRAKRVLKPGGHLLAFSGNRTHHRLFTGVEDAGYEIRDTMTWHYGGGFPKSADVSKLIDRREGMEDEREVVDTDYWGSGKLNDGEGEEYEITVPASDKGKQWAGWKTALKPATEYVVMARKPFKGATVDCVLEHGTGALNIDSCRIDRNGKDANADNGRYPSNVSFDEIVAKGMNNSGDGSVPFRYFYTSKPSKAERTLDGKIDNAHPTVKPQDLMEWLIKLVTREGQIVIDPFTGSGTTCKAAKDLNRRFIGIEKQEKWADVARVRCNLTPDNPSIVRDDKEQDGLENYN